MVAFYPIGPSFEYLPCYHALVKNSNLLAMGEPPTPELQGTDARKQRELDGVGPHQATGVAGSSPRVARPGGNKAAKRNKVLKRKAEAELVEGNEDGGAIMAQLGSLAEAITQDTKLKRRRHEDTLRVQAHKLALFTFNSLYAGVSMSLAERRAALEELQQDYLPKAAATSEATTTDVGDLTHESHRHPPAHLNHSVYPEGACATR
ncbi:hypothetical protein BU14_0191s0016 [Porphyra umbilicalis]|uniref:No apical meristem-associated C-terminal domain-containing protein n=1 Tax=Porphyra umbilicalis TaxID=2786 RepID=A0A1X6P6P9_PORUM|nr:hypothetical protein BU14_0191s0016 [Porphyra umbilicalis]|eukprot:OSX76436.1 hypothetical protein BU14_0191s0016 [Porphyra umbilicalis]